MNSIWYDGQGIKHEDNNHNWLLTTVLVVVAFVIGGSLIGFVHSLF